MKHLYYQILDGYGSVPLIQIRGCVWFEEKNHYKFNKSVWMINFKMATIKVDAGYIIQKWIVNKKWIASQQKKKEREVLKWYAREIQVWVREGGK